MLLNEDEIACRLGLLPTWHRDGRRITCNLTFANFSSALAFVNRVGELAEADDHHPDILIHDWNKVTLSLTTHSEAGLTQRDFDLAEKIDALLRPDSH
jgi:4a-hydroxytetrahydrobiopterin dehydratase